MLLVEKVSRLQEQLGVVAESGCRQPLGTKVQSIAEQLGLWEDLKGKPLVEQTDACYNTVFGGAVATKIEQVVVTGRVVTVEPAKLDGRYFSFKTGGNPDEVVDRFEARQQGDHVTYYRNGPVGSKTVVDSATARPMESYKINGVHLHGPVGATVKANGDIEYTHGYTSRREGVVVAGEAITPAQPAQKLGSTPSHGNPRSTNALNTELNNVARNTNDTARVRMLVGAGADLSSTNGAQWRHTPLHQACYHGRYEMAKALLELGANTTLHSNPCGRGRSGTPLELARGGGHHHIVKLLEEAQSGGPAPILRADDPEAAAPHQDKFHGDRLWDHRLHPNGGPRADQVLPCITVCCAVPFTVCPLHCLSAWGCDCVVDVLTSRWVRPGCTDVCCCPCSPNSMNPLWCCAQPLGWAASFGQLHTVMSLVANGAKPHTRNLAGENAFSDAKRERHVHVVEWLEAWERAGKPTAPGNQHMRREPAQSVGGLDAHDVQGCYVGACIIPILVTSFYVQASGADELRASGFTLIVPWSYSLRRSAESPTKFELRAHDQNQDWFWHESGCCFWGSPGWWAIKVVPTSC
uniref:Uncharacterized protein n=1 Tax=Calcidiscus leptoporus TaxID=127549 RepID=A0A7S0JLX5_9EUKA